MYVTYLQPIKSVWTLLKVRKPRLFRLLFLNCEAYLAREITSSSVAGSATSPVEEGMTYGEWERSAPHSASMPVPVRLQLRWYWSTEKEALFSPSSSHCFLYTVASCENLWEHTLTSLRDSACGLSAIYIYIFLIPRVIFGLKPKFRREFLCWFKQFTEVFWEFGQSDVTARGLWKRMRLIFKNTL